MEQQDSQNCIEKRLSVRFSLKFDDIQRELGKKIPNGQILRFISSNFNENFFDAHLLMTDTDLNLPNIFEFKKASFKNETDFNVCFLIPTGIGCEIGGHAGDGTPALKLIASQCDNIITHPNVVNASDINESPSNALYVEGHHITRVLMGTAGLLKSRKNRQLVLIDSSQERKKFERLAINSVNAARATLGIEAEIIVLDQKINMEATLLKDKATGKITNLSSILNYLEDKLEKEIYNAIAITSPIKVPENTHETYSTSHGEMINPWGGVESMLTHVISSKFDIPSAHAPMFENERIANLDLGVVDARIAPEIVSSTFFHCVLKGLHNAPQIVPPENGISAKDISALIIPDNTLGLPVLAALHQGIKVIAVKNKNTMSNDLSRLPWQKGQFFQCNNYLEASGILGCLKSGIAPEAVKRPLETLLEAKESKMVPRLSNKDSSVQAIH